MELGLPTCQHQPPPQHVPCTRQGGPAPVLGPHPVGSEAQILLQATPFLLFIFRPAEVLSWLVQTTPLCAVRASGRLPLDEDEFGNGVYVT